MTPKDLYEIWRTRYGHWTRWEDLTDASREVWLIVWQTKQRADPAYQLAVADEMANSWSNIKAAAR